MRHSQIDLGFYMIDLQQEQHVNTSVLWTIANKNDPKITVPKSQNKIKNHSRNKRFKKQNIRSYVFGASTQKKLYLLDVKIKTTHRIHHLIMKKKNPPPPAPKATTTT